MHILGCFLGLLLAVFFIAFSLGLRLWLIILKFFGIKDNMNGFGSNNGTYHSTNNAYSGQSSSQQTNSSSSTQHSSSSHGKVFADNEGEYVDFEDVKD